MVGEQIGPYRIVGELGAGGMSVVYEAEDLRLQRRVAVKVLPVGTRHDREAVERFLREARIASSLTHPNICVVHDVGEHEGRPYIVMERLDGEPLSRIIAGKPLATARLLDLACQIADALEAAHARGIVHRDVKPANVLVTRRGEAKVLDFGIATLAGSAADEAAALGGGLTVSGLAVGTINYMSPEQARGEESDARSDLFSFGVVLYEMATGRLPFGSGTTAVLFDGLLNRAPEPPLALNPTLPLDLERTIERALEKDRALRFQSAADLRAELELVRRSLTALPRADADLALIVEARRSKAN